MALKFMEGSMISLPFATVLAASVLTTSFISGVFGMAGGMILMGIYLALMPLPAAMALHGATQVASNAWRAWMWREHIHWQLVRKYAIGAGAALAVFVAGFVAPSKAVALIALGAITFIGLWLPAQLAPNILGRGQAAGAGLLCTVLQFVCGVSGPIFDVFFVRSNLSRKPLVATKAAIQTVGHTLKFGYFTYLLFLSGEYIAPAAALLAMALAPVGTQLSSRALDAITDAQFRKWSRWLIASLAAFYLISGVAMQF
jgi:uncharacterized membrane protein YfcA